MAIENEAKCRVVRIIARLNIGGPAIHAIILTEGLDTEKFDSQLVAGRVGNGEKDMLYLARQRKVFPVIIPQLGRAINPVNDLIALVKLLGLIKKQKPHIVHTHTAKAGALGRLAGLLYNLTRSRASSRCALIHTFHGTVLQGYFSRLLSKVFICIERLLALFTDRIIVVSETLKRELLGLNIGTKEKISVIPLGLFMDELLSIKTGAVNLPVRVTIVGRLVPIKNHRMFLDTAKFMQASLSSRCRFIIIGDGELRPDLEEYALRLGLKDRVEFRGWQENIVKIYSEADIVVLTSLNEGTPLSLIEAMAASRPIVATEVGGVRDIFFKTHDSGILASGKVKIFDNGIVCNSGDIKGMSEALGMLIDNAGLRKLMGENGRSYVKERFSKERLLKDMELLYNMVLKYPAL